MFMHLFTQEAKAQQQVQQQAKIAQDLRAMFIALDEDGSGTLTREDRGSDVNFVAVDSVGRWLLCQGMWTMHRLHDRTRFLTHFAFD